MFNGLTGGAVAARRGMYRHPLVRALMPLLGPLPAGRGWSARALALGAVLMSWDAAPTLAQRFESALAVLDTLPRRRRTGRTYQGFVKALSRGRGVLEALAGRLRLFTERAASGCWRVGEWTPIGVDGSRFDAPRTLANEALGLAGRDKCGPQMVALLLVHLGSMLPWAWRLGPVCESERSLLRSMLGVLPARTLLVADAGFVGFDLLSMLRGQGVHFLVRVGRGVHLLRGLGCYRREGRDTVYLWPDRERSRPPLVLRLIRIGDVHLITDVTDPKGLSKKAAAELYRRRWGLELAFRSLKQTLERRKVRSGAPGNAMAELGWTIAGMWALSLLGVRAVVGAGHGPRRLSLAKALAAVRAAHRGGSERALRRRLRRAVQDHYRRRSSKRAYRWPHKKRPQPPGPPRLTIATAAQVREAQRLRSQRQAA